MFIECDVDEQGHFEKALRKKIRQALKAENVKAEVVFRRIPDDCVQDFDMHLPAVVFDWMTLDGGPEGPDLETIRAGIREILEGEEIILRRYRETGRSWPWAWWVLRGIKNSQKRYTISDLDASRARGKGRDLDTPAPVQEVAIQGVKDGRENKGDVQGPP